MINNNHISLQGDNNQEIAEFLKTQGIEVINAEIFPIEPCGHKFKIGDKCRIHGMETYTEFNGEIVTISEIRQDGKHGNAYYFTTTKPELVNLNWTYEYRLELLPPTHAGGIE